MNSLAAVFAVCALVPSVHCAIGGSKACFDFAYSLRPCALIVHVLLSAGWCYHQASCSEYIPLRATGSSSHLTALW